jgi:hypothetical protein
MRRFSTVLVAILALLGVDCLHPGFAADEAWPVQGKLVGKKDKKAKDVSGIACLPGGPPRKCLVIDDEVQFAQIVIVRDGALIAGDTIPLVDPADTPWNIDGEGVTFSSGGGSKPDYFYIIGSHGHPRDRERTLDALSDAGEIKARFDASSVLVRLPLAPSAINPDGRLAQKPKGTTLVDLRPMIYLEPALAPLRPFLGKRLEESHGGLTVEGIAAAEVGSMPACGRRPFPTGGRW